MYDEDVASIASSSHSFQPLVTGESPAHLPNKYNVPLNGTDSTEIQLNGEPR